MSKTIAYCADGTWDSSASHTNVYKLYKGLTTSASQVPLYDDGVGAEVNPILKVVEGAFGTGLWQKIKDGYTKIAQIYEAGDSLFLFGFSRGAFTARSLAGMITACGLPTQDFADGMVSTIFDAYRNESKRASLPTTLASCKLVIPDITMVGVWDTVGSLGIPSAIGGIDPIAYGFLDTKLHPNVKNACQALAMDERRAQFPPTLWQGPAAPGQTLEQIWFTGCHSDVGGGEPDDVAGTTALSDITLAWMMSKAAPLGLQFAAAVSMPLPLDSALALDNFHESWKVINGVPIRRKIADNSSIANSVVVRCAGEASWRPENLAYLNKSNGALAASYEIVSVVKPLEIAAGA
ncbi:MAG: DUF2235 domain-containing protein [Bryobacteraceae bacterium]